MKRYFLCFTLESDASFSRGDGLAGEVDSEIQFDELGCPFLSGKAVKGILVNECADLLAVLPGKRWQDAANRLFGTPGQLDDNGSLLRVGDARLPADLREALTADLQSRLKKEEDRANSSDLSRRKAQVESGFREEILSTLTAIRSQTAIEENGVAKDRSLRSRRVILRETPFEVELVYLGEDNIADDQALLAACVAAFRRAGTNRNRGLGKLRAHLEDENHQSINIREVEILFQGVTK